VVGERDRRGGPENAVFVDCPDGAHVARVSSEPDSIIPLRSRTGNGGLRVAASRKRHTTMSRPDIVPAPRVLYRGAKRHPLP
jgi:hypothetical protein